MALSLSPATREKLKEILICFSLGNLLFVRRWYDLEILQENGLDYLRPGPATPALLYSTLIAGLIVAALFWLGWQSVRNKGPVWIRLAHACFLAAMLFPLESVRRYWIAQYGRVDLASNTALLSIEALLLGGLIMALWGNPRVVRAGRHVALMMTFMFPALMIDFFSSHLSSPPASVFQPKKPAAFQAVAPGARRFIWIIFDEMDQRVAFAERPVSLELPELDRLRSESLEARRATQTADRTLLAVPMLISGKSYRKSEIAGAAKLNVFPVDSSQGVNWADERTIFHRVHDMGVNAAVAGWYHAYCRLFGDQLVECFNTSTHTGRALLREQNASEVGVAGMAMFLFRLQFENLKDMFRLDGISGSENLKDAHVQHEQLQAYFQIREHAYAEAEDPRVGFVYLHFPTPHMYAIYNRWRREFTLDSDIDYLDNLALVDRTVGELRARLEADGLWDRTTILITADHGFRPDMWRGRYGWSQNMEHLFERGPSQQVPFILKLAGRREHVIVNRAFSNILASDLAMAVLKGQVSTSGQAADWIERRAAETDLLTSGSGATSPSPVAAAH